jgi:hypothetical protein
MSSCSPLDAMCPCGRFVVAGAGLEAAVQDAHEPVGELTQCGVVFGASGFELIVVGTGAGRGVQFGFLRDVAAPGAGERGADLGDRQPRRRSRVRCLGQQLQGIGGVQILKDSDAPVVALAGRLRLRPPVPPGNTRATHAAAAALSTAAEDDDLVPVWRR